MPENLNKLINPKLIVPNLSATQPHDLLLELMGNAQKAYPELNAPQALALLLEREKEGSTAVGHGIAFPHVRLPHLKQTLLLVGRSLSGVDFSSLDHKLVNLFFLILAPQDQSYLKILARLSKTCNNEKFLDAAMACQTTEDFCKLLEKTFN